MPRSGTTWLSQILTTSGELRLLHEPDNERISYPGYVFKARLPRFPFLTEAAGVPAYRHLFDLALHNRFLNTDHRNHRLAFALTGQSKSIIGRRLTASGTGNLRPTKWEKSLVHWVVGAGTTDRKLIKSVHGLLALPFLMHHFDIQPLILMRNPLSIFSSQILLNSPDRDRAIYRQAALQEKVNLPLGKIADASPDQRAGIQVAIFYRLIEQFLVKYPAIQLVFYEDLLRDPFQAVERLTGRLGTTFDQATRTYIESRMKPGEGYQTFRDPKVMMDIWKTRLNDQQIDHFLRGYRLIPNSFLFQLC